MITPPPPPEFLAHLPELTAFARTTTRLHPRPGPVTAAESHIGGPLRWPADEPWPTCTTPVLVREDVPLPDELLERLRAADANREQQPVLTREQNEVRAEIARFVGEGYTGFGSFGDGPVMGHRYAARPHPVPNPMVAVAQLRASDIPDLPRPDGADLLQVLWCPGDHATQPAGPVLHLRWRHEAGISAPSAVPPVGEIGREALVPRPCRLHPEQVVEYPFPEELPQDLLDRVDTWDDKWPEATYVDVAMAPGWKVGGYADWSLTGLGETPCPVCAEPADLLLVIDSEEFDSTSRERWRPADDPDPESSAQPTGVVVGRWGALRIFACLRCPGTPYVVDQQ
ncbi:hypothetical protein [Actinoplanes friuliensis]|uniref:DUF1963 domain-containing protein n=1 Tax=Actinoplanes friuliensis DSM 7358 TaxID=1246995 RepID=U5W1R6_9ACTN|nr:hypothetical protein [Actinoplanes friuliensis]AGZ43044.1 hypothetical protein AFR_23880 [Actinoplanes friuliensis DSM 7358]